MVEKFTQKHFKLLAQMLGEATDLEEFKEQLIKVFVEDNERFDVTRFKKAVEAAKKAKEGVHA